MAMASGANGEGSSRTIREVMRASSTNTPDVVVLERLPSGLDHKEVLDPKEDLWLSTADGRYSSPIIPLRVGTAPYQEVFQVHKNILLKAEWFRKALLGEFAEAEAQLLDLPEEDPGIFHFLVAYLYEEKYVPTKPLSTVLVPDSEANKGKGKETGNDTPESDSDSDALSWRSDSSAQSRRRRERRRRRDERHFERLRQKHPGAHRPHCTCPQCANSHGPPCWSCSAPRVAPPITPPLPQPFVHAPIDRSRRNHRRRGPDGRPVPSRPGSPPAPTTPPADQARIKGEDMRTWLMAYELNLDVYICANKFLLDDFKEKISRVAIDMLETAGSDAAHIQVLRLCRKLYDGVSDNDRLLRMVLARVGFLQSTLWKRAPEETNEFLVENPEVSVLILKETVTRREDDFQGRTLPSMERPWVMPPPPRMDNFQRPFHARGVQHYDLRY